jgi:hypothetical protein
MKKVKIMLLSLLVLAVVGGAMAFNARTTTKFCTIAPNQDGSCPTSPASCPITATTQKVTTGTGLTVCYTTDLGQFNDCSGVTTCTTKVTITAD